MTESNVTFAEIAAAARFALKKKGLPELYGRRLEFELEEIDKQGATKVWVDYISDPEVRWDSNPNNMLLPWLFGRVDRDPIAGREPEVVTTTRYREIMEIMTKRGRLPDDIVMDADKPDIDIDCLPIARDEIKAYATKIYSRDVTDGYGTVCSVSTWMTYLMRQAIIDAAQATEWVTKAEAMKLTTELPDEVDDLKDNGMSTCKNKIKNEDGSESDCKTKHALAACPKCGSSDTEGPTIGKLLAEHKILSDFYGTSAAHRDTIDYAVRLVGRVKSMGKHAGALVITDRPLYGNIPLYRRATNKKKGQEDDQWMSLWTEGRNTQLSKFGYTKWDVLGIKNLQYIYFCCKMIERNHGISFGKNLDGWDDIDPDDSRAGHYFDRDGNKVKIDLNDPGAIGLANELRTDAVFQFDTNLAKKILSNGVRNFYDLVVFNSMGHPGPMQCVRSQSKISTDQGPVAVDDLDPARNKIAYLNNRGSIGYTSDYTPIRTGRRRLVRISLVDGRQLDLTPDHPVLTAAGYKQAGTITTEDEIICADDI